MPTEAFNAARVKSTRAEMSLQTPFAICSEGSYTKLMGAGLANANSAIYIPVAALFTFQHAPSK
eukprot:6188318-Pleurochrysis_carterae.AAC.2